MPKYPCICPNDRRILSPNVRSILLTLECNYEGCLQNHDAGSAPLPAAVSSHTQFRPCLPPILQLCQLPPLRLCLFVPVLTAPNLYSMISAPLTSKFEFSIHVYSDSLPVFCTNSPTLSVRIVMVRNRADHPKPKKS